MSKPLDKMSFSELKNELYKCKGTNPVKEKIIRNLMMVEYNKHLNVPKHTREEVPVSRTVKKGTNSNVDEIDNDPLDETVHASNYSCRKQIQID